MSIKNIIGIRGKYDYKRIKQLYFVDLDIEEVVL